MPRPEASAHLSCPSASGGAGSSVHVAGVAAVSRQGADVLLGPELRAVVVADGVGPAAGPGRALLQQLGPGDQRPFLGLLSPPRTELVRRRTESAIRRAANHHRLFGDLDAPPGEPARGLRDRRFGPGPRPGAKDAKSDRGDKARGDRGDRKPKGEPARDKPRKDVAVYIDYENLYISLRSTVGQNPNFDIIMDKCREFGRLTICRAYADWSEFARVVTSQMFSRSWP